MTGDGARLPDFLVIGAMKAGTTSLHRYLRAHPEVFMPATKELDFFAVAKNWGRGPEWYANQFAAAGDARAVGEASPAYANDPNHPGVPRRIAAMLPEVRLVYVIRHPVERIESHYRHRVRFEGERRSADRAVFQEFFRYLPPSRYAYQIECYLEHFARDRLLVLRSEDLRDERPATLARVFRFLGVDEQVVPDAIAREHLTSDERVGRRRRWRVRDHAAPLSPEGRAEVTELLRPDVCRLRAHLGPDFDGWDIG